MNLPGDSAALRQTRVVAQTARLLDYEPEAFDWRVSRSYQVTAIGETGKWKHTAITRRSRGGAHGRRLD
jgi:hypothetical protein